MIAVAASIYRVLMFQTCGSHFTTAGSSFIMVGARLCGYSIPMKPYKNRYYHRFQHNSSTVHGCSTAVILFLSTCKRK